MSRQLLLKELAAYKTPFREEQEYLPRFVSLLQNFPSCFGRSLLSGHITGSAWVVSSDGREVVLLHHRKLDRWLQPGGHADGEEEVLKVAEKELREETGLANFRWASNSIFDIDIHLIPENAAERAHFHYDIRFLALADPAARLTANKESKSVRWVNLNDIQETSGFERSILRMVEKTKGLKLPIL